MTANQHMDALPPELKLLLSCARARTSADNDLAIGRLLESSIDWKFFASLAVRHGLANLAGQSLLRLGSDSVPEDILDALQTTTDQLRRRNTRLLDELWSVVDALRNEDIEAIPFGGPILAVRGYGDLGLRAFGHLDILVEESNMAPAVSVLRRLGWENGNALRPSQAELIWRLDGRQRLSRKGADADLCVHVRFTPLNWALDIDYPLLWRRAEPTVLSGRAFRTLSIEDELLASVIRAVRGGRRSLKALCDVAVLSDSHPGLNWAASIDLARRQGCCRVLLATARLADKYFGAAAPAFMTAADPVVSRLESRLAARWCANDTPGRAGDGNAIIDLLLLHDRTAQRARYLVRTALLPKPHHVASIALPRNLAFAYAPIKLAWNLSNTLVKKPYRRLRSRMGRLRNRIVASRPGLALLPGSPEAKRRIQTFLTARNDANRQLAANPKDPGAWCQLGNALSGLKRFEEAIACYDKGLHFVPDGVSLWQARADAVRALKQRTHSVVEEEPEPAPNDVDGWVRRAGFLLALQRYGDAAVASDRALAIDPRHTIATRIGIRARLSSCDWRGRESDKRKITECVSAGVSIITPFNHRTISDSEAENLMVARLWAKGLPRLKPKWNGEVYRHKRIRVGYISGEFHDHPMTIAMAGVYEHHDKTRFELTAISIGPKDEGRMRKRIESAFDRFVHAQAMGDAEIACLLREGEIDIAVDLNGYAGSGRSGILSHRPAPVQVNFLAYCGTMGVPFMDYIVADRILIPEENERFYAEKVVRLPHTYMPNDNTRVVSETAPCRVELGLPRSGIVFSCHNGEHKFAPEIFDIWMKLLLQVEGSVLWLKEPHASAVGNLRREARARGVSPDRLVFAARVPDPADHLARLGVADLFLDTLPYNAHATACDALWAGVPVLTCTGNTFAGRVAASLLHALDMPELVASSLEEYGETALLLARNPARLSAIRAKLLRNRDHAPLFDTPRFTRDLESAYAIMWERSEQGLAPAGFSVPDVRHSALGAGA